MLIFDHPPAPKQKKRQQNIEADVFEGLELSSSTEPPSDFCIPPYNLWKIFTGKREWESDEKYLNGGTEG